MSCLFLNISIVLVLSVIGLTSSFTVTTTGEGGEACGPEGLQCLDTEAECDVTTGRCNCVKNRFPEGTGYLNCYRNSEYFTEMINDPQIVSFNNKTVDFSLPCRFLITNFTSGLEDKRKNNVGKCTFIVHGFQQKDKGKMYLAGYDVALKLEYDNGQTYQASLRKTGKADNGTYQYTVLATDNQFLPDGPWGSDVIDYHDTANNIKVRCLEKEEDNIMQLIAKKCGVRIRLRGYDTTLRRGQTLMPGLSLAISRAFPPITFLSTLGVSMIPFDQPNGWDIDQQLVGSLDRRQSLIYKALTSGVAQNQPEENAQCGLAVNFLNNCADDDQLKEAFDNCLWMFKAPRFVRCFDNTVSGERIMGLFNNCTSIYCGSTRGDLTCASVMADITQSNCHTVERYPLLTKLVAGDLCPSTVVIPGRRRRR